MTEPIDLGRIKAYCEAAPPGPWGVTAGGSVVRRFPENPGRIEHMDWCGPAGAFSVNARADLPAVVAELEVAEGMITALRALFEDVVEGKVEIRYRRDPCGWHVTGNPWYCPQPIGPCPTAAEAIDAALAKKRESAQ